ncbi:MAG: NRDE family protein [Labilithrix sp.]|nr:NRDE family protein [Labilithrix sp.]
MCTLFIAARAVPGASLVVVANRDEQRDRASSPPLRWDGFVAPRDDVAGGTWLGLNDQGVFVAITNRYLGMRDAARVTRGALVTDALRSPSARAIHEAMSRLDPARHNGFHLVYADDRDVLATVSDGRELSQLTLGDGLSIVTERSFGAGDGDRDRDGARVRKILTRWSHLGAADPFDPARVTSLLAEHDSVDPLGATCIHLDALRYGTRSAMVLGVAEARAGAEASPFGRARMLWAEGPPCTAPFTAIDLASLARAEPEKSR